MTVSTTISSDRLRAEPSSAEVCMPELAGSIICTRAERKWLPSVSVGVVNLYDARHEGFAASS